MGFRLRRQRCTHYLRPNHGSAIPRNLCFVQTHGYGTTSKTEPDTRIERLDIGAAIVCRLEEGRSLRYQALDFTEPQHFWTFLLRRCRRKNSMWLIGDGIAQSLTLLNVWKLIDERFFSLTAPRKANRQLDGQEEREHAEQEGFLVDGDPPTILLLYHQHGCIHVVDSRNYGDGSIERMAAELGRVMPHKPTDVTKAKQWQKWLMARTMVVHDWMTELMLWWKAENLGQWRHTLASLSMGAYRHRFMPFKILVHDCEPALKLEREALVGGQTSVHKLGHVLPLLDGDRGRHARGAARHWETPAGPVYHVDVNSLYPAMMKGRLYPREFVCWKESSSIDDWKQWRQELLVIAQVQLDSEQEAYPYFEDGERYWAVGRFWTALCGDELTRAVESGHVVQWGRMAAYLPARIFDDFVDYFHALRLAAKARKAELTSNFARLVMNSLAGKFGQRHHLWDFAQYHDPPLRWGTWPEVNADDNTIRIYRAIAGHVQLRGIQDEALESCPAIEAYVNMHAREWMRQARLIAGAENVLYQSTDALHLLQEGYDRIACLMETYPGELGRFRLKNTYQRYELRGIHDYTGDEVDVIAGIMADAAPVGSRSFKQWQSPTLRTILTHEPGGFLKIKRVKLTLGGYNAKGIVNRDGSVSPPQVLDAQLHFDREHPDSIPWVVNGKRK